MLKKVVIGVVALFVVVGVIGSLGGNETGTGTGSSSTREPTAVPQPTEIPVTQLADAYDANAVAAKAEWNGKLVQFSAEVTNITESGLNFTKVTTKTFSLTQIACRVQDKSQLLSLKKGQTVTVRGVVGDQTVGVIELRSCSVIG